MTYIYSSEISRHAQGPTEFGIVGVYDNTRVTIQLPKGVKKYSSNTLKVTVDRLSTYQVCIAILTCCTTSTIDNYKGKCPIVTKSEYSLMLYFFSFYLAPE